MMGKNENKQFQKRRRERLARHKKRRAAARRRFAEQQSIGSLPVTSAFGRLLANFWVKARLKQKAEKEETGT